MSWSVGNSCFSQPEICSGDHCSASFCATRHRSFRCSTKRQGLGRNARSPGTPIGLVSTIGLPAAVAPDLPAHCRWRPSEALGKLPDRPAYRNATGNLFAFLKPECCQGSPARRRRDPSVEDHDPLNTGLVLPFQRPRDGRRTLSVLPSLPQLGLLRCCEPNP